MTSALFQSYTIPQGVLVRVANSGGILQHHRLKHDQHFHDGERMYASMRDMSFLELGTGVIGLALLEATGFIVFATGVAKWPYIVAYHDGRVRGPGQVV